MERPSFSSHKIGLAANEMWRSCMRTEVLAQIVFTNQRKETTDLPSLPSWTFLPHSMWKTCLNSRRECCIYWRSTPTFSFNSVLTPAVLAARPNPLSSVVTVGVSIIAPNSVDRRMQMRVLPWEMKHMTTRMEVKLPWDTLRLCAAS